MAAVDLLALTGVAAIFSFFTEGVAAEDLLVFLDGVTFDLLAIEGYKHNTHTCAHTYAQTHTHKGIMKYCISLKDRLV